MVLNFRLGDVTPIAPEDDSMGRSWYGYDPAASPEELWAQNRGVYPLAVGGIDGQRFASLSYRGTVLLVAEITGWEPFTDPKTGAFKKALIGDLIDSRDRRAVAALSQVVPGGRNPVGYFDDSDWGLDADADADDAPGHGHGPGRGSSQGWQSDPERRKQVEDAAQDRLMAHYVADGWTVEDTRFSQSYDAVARRGDGDAAELVYLEAKGTETAGAAVLVTVGEVEHARAHLGRCVMGVLSDVRFDADGALDPDAGTFRMLPFEPADDALAATGYRWALPPGAPATSI